MDELIEIGIITKPQGLKGEIKVQAINPDLNRFLSYEYIYIDTIKHSISKCRVQNGFVYLFLNEVNSIDEAEKLRNKKIYIDNTQLPILDNDEYYIRDLIGCDALLDGDVLGQIVDVSDYSSVSTITIQSKNGEILFPFLNSVIDNIDIANKVINLNKCEFEKVRVDED